MPREERIHRLHRIPVKIQRQPFFGIFISQKAVENKRQVFSGQFDLLVKRFLGVCACAFQTVKILPENNCSVLKSVQVKESGKVLDVYKRQPLR